MKRIVLIALVFLSCPVQAQTFCTKSGDSIRCNDYENPYARENLEKEHGRDSWEYRRGTENLDRERQERIDAEIKKIHEREQDERNAETNRKQRNKMFGLYDPVKIDADGFYY